jgi:uncharacterized protein (DUF983 family)
MTPDKTLIRLALKQKCPRCGIGDLYKPGLSLTVRDLCDHCGLALAKNDSGDGPAVFLIFILGFSLVPAALLVEVLFAPPLWVHAVLWTVVALTVTIGALRPLKAYIIALQFKHRASEWRQ